MKRFFKFLDDEFFWQKFEKNCISLSLVSKLKKCKSTKKLPRNSTIIKFIEEYKIIFWDTRNIDELLIYFLIEVNE